MAASTHPAPVPALSALASASDPGDALTFDQLRLFLAVVDAGGFSAAARQLRRAQSAVSYGVANLEKQLGTVLFDRSARKPALTRAGQELAAEARAVCSQVDRLRARAHGIARGVEPRLAIVVDHMFPLPALVHALREFRDRYPTVSLTLHTEALGAVAELVADGRCSVGIGAEVPKWPAGLERRPLAKVVMVHVAAPEHPLAHWKGPVPGHVVRGEVQIVLADRSRLSEDYEIGVYSDRKWRVLDLAAKHAILRAGLGWGGMPTHVVADDLAHGRLVRIHLEQASGPAFEAFLFALHRAAEPPGPAAQWLLGRLATHCDGQRAKKRKK
ncbi:MAG TPA: LysR family transcriptional regulator [Polyangiaceae bacterium]|nr:LysR family transcriptional regulator [Polyangiaceae bacterium]